LSSLPPSPTSSSENKDMAALRLDYRQASLLESDVDPNPLTQFSNWFAQTRPAGVPEPNAMTLATVKSGRPSARVVLLKGIDTGFCFYTNFQSNKGKELAAYPFAALVFLWHELERQVRIEGRIEIVEAPIADAYYASRPKSSQIGAWASPQSQVIESRQILQTSEAEFTAKFEGQTITRPAHWGGYRLVPDMIEFWQGRPSRLHDRIRYDLHSSHWKISRLAP
jgi:pyridoxamine 5'-phosphate oxidase